jgi:predicted RNA methylase
VLCTVRTSLQVALFDEPNYHLEQYPTSAQMAAPILYTINQSFEDITGKRAR